MLFAKRFGTSEPEIEVFGKPTKSTFDYARRLLDERSADIGLPPGKPASSTIERIYMVGGGSDFAVRWDASRTSACSPFSVGLRL